MGTVIKVRYHADIDELLRVGGAKSDWIDLRCAHETVMRAGDYQLIPLGVSIELPNGYEALVAPRSSTFKNFGIIQANSIGIIDESYCGDDDQWHFPAVALRDTVIPFNARIAQFRIIEHQPRLAIQRVEHLRDVNRGGLGSSGIM